FFHFYLDLPHLPSFPTRRSSDLRRSQTSTPCVQTMVLIFGATRRINCTTGERFGCPANTSLALRLAARNAVTARRPLDLSQPVNTNSRPPTAPRCSFGVSFKLSRRQSHPRLEANSVSTAAKWRP